MTKKLARTLSLLLAFAPAVRPCAGAATDPSLPFRTDSANENLSWYQIKPGEFPPIHSEHRVSGTLVEADFLHRTGQFRTDGTGVLANFKLPPFGLVHYLNTEADLRDVPLGTHLTFFLYQDQQGAFTQAADVLDEYTLLASQGLSYRLDEAKADALKLNVTRQNVAQTQPDLGHAELSLDACTRYWKGDKPAKLGDLAAGDMLLVNLGGAGAGPCTDVWIGADTIKLATEQERKKHEAFVKFRGLPAWIDGLHGKRMDVTVLGDPVALQALLKGSGIDVADWTNRHRRIGAAVANLDLRSYNPPVDQQNSAIIEHHFVPTDRYGCSGLQWTIEPGLLLEGFRRGHVIRLFPEGWKIDDMPFGETMYNERGNSKIEEESANQYSYRTDFANEDLPWYRLQPGKFPPFQSHHLVTGELLKADPVQRTGQLKVDVTGQLVDFTMPPFRQAMRLDAEADLRDLPLGQRYQFFMYPDDKGTFTQAGVIKDEATYLASERFTYRYESTTLDGHTLRLACMLEKVRNDKDDLVRPPDVGAGEFAIDDSTHFWKGEQAIKASDLVVGDELIFNMTGRTPTSRGRCTDVWVGADTHKRVKEQQRAKQAANLKAHGLPAWVESVDGKRVVVTFFAAYRQDFPPLLEGDPYGKPVFIKLADDHLQPLSQDVIRVGFDGHLPEGETAGTYGCSGHRWQFQMEKPTDGIHPNAVVRIFKEGWPLTPPGEASGK